MEIMKHFSHEHPLILKDAAAPKADERAKSKKKADERKVICYGCQRPISEVEPAYGCRECSKDYFLHKVCAELPREIIHPKHDKHSLFLLSISPYGGKNYCDVCRKYLYGFTYHCSLCRFDLDIPCALKDNINTLCAFKDRIVTNEGHEHSLIFQPRAALFRCDACGVEDKDLFYICPSCPFLIHKSCASLPSTGKREDLDQHTLSLVYGLPSDYKNLKFDCDICRQRIFHHYWAYYCRLCRYFVHLKCMTTETHQIEANSDDDLLDDANFEQKLLKVLLDDDLFHLPTTDISGKLIKRFLFRKNSLAQIEPEIEHWSHKKHHLVLFSHEQQNDKDKEEDDDEEEILCNCCIEPISAPLYYSCVECDYFLHLPCAKLPSTLQHPSHPHPLTLNKYSKFYSVFKCNNCGWSSNGFFFQCKTCNFFLDVKCAALPTVIEHEKHNHPLLQFEASNKLCNACGCKINGLAFGCESCEFHLHFECVMRPRAIRHRWDKHPLPLRFPPYSDHPDDFYCDMCEEEMHPKRWLYHCSECDNTFHPNCVPKIGRYPNIKFGGILEVSSHLHPLEYKRKATLKSSCDGCGANIDRYTAFECEDCNFCLCRPCVRKMS